jgi:hypothetical protein
MFISVNISKDVDLRMNQLCDDVVINAINILANKYNFNVEEAITKTSVNPKHFKSHNRKRNGYLLFTSLNRDKVKDKISKVDGVNVTSQLVTSDIALQWRSLSQDERNNWNLRARSFDMEQFV